MDASPLVKAHDHARAAAVATRQASDTTVAISEHTQAAGEFANAASHTSSLEALRTLKLLEDHHTRLAALLKLPPSSSSAAASNSASDELSSEKYPEKTRAPSVVVVDDGGVEGRGASTPPRRDGPPRGPSHPPRFAAREMSSSIASNLASARGIRSKYRGQPLSPSVSNDQAPGNVDPHPRRDGSRTKMESIINHQTGKPTWVPPMNNSSPSSPQKLQPASSLAPSPRTDADMVEDGGYARFYNTFGSIINKISAPLAFAGLPLIQEESSLVSEPTPPVAANSSPSAAAKRAQQPRPQSSGVLEPDLSKIYSKATMRALARDGHSASDSFYVVPTSGHTMSYANILTYAEKEKRRLEASTQGELSMAGDDEDDFVDARESLVPMSPGTRRKFLRVHSEKELRNTIEELSLENRSLKDMLDNVSKRLHAFEASSQHSAMALAESYRVMRPGSPGSTSNGGRQQPDEGMRRRAQDAEEQMVGMMKQMERLERDNRKMQRTLDKYREKWEKLKAGAKARREAQVGESVEDARQS
ncbi:hypothetical protein CDD80_3157 [Ophiocordyceps camponoti-rufipedis]|uniref:Uncharacterized protein n=1 Tax=Ophiocordyceps camponoti-rufipedis TaxID=2004952 RepID=A0A2C5Y8F7_9HYPO|nr:hypothetical protein CDD80_3157 [Ophiocordyceps camponoti-rufipedis]